MAADPIAALLQFRCMVNSVMRDVTVLVIDATRKFRKFRNSVRGEARKFGEQVEQGRSWERRARNSKGDGGSGRKA